MGEFLIKLAIGMVLGIVVAAPVALFVFVYGLVAHRSFSKASSLAGAVFLEIAGKIWSDTA